ncbi:hypothetical protein FHG87_015473 [Trinorchestia longiramus]|nr:hypothetical protein FHG87_015473 [Trinorchestia longiramus]
MLVCTQVFNKEGGNNRRVQTELPHRQKASVRGLSELVDSTQIWQRLHTANVWLMAACGARLVEVMAPACDLFTCAQRSLDSGANFADSETDLVGPKKWSVDTAVDVARDVDDSEMKIKREINGSKNEKNKGTNLKENVKVCRAKTDEYSSKKEPVEGGRLDKENFCGMGPPEEIKDGTRKGIFVNTGSEDKAFLERSSGVTVDKECEDSIVSECKSSLLPAKTSSSTDKLSQKLKPVRVAHMDNSSLDNNERPNSVDDSSLDLMSEDASPADVETAVNSLSSDELLTLRDLRELLGGDQFGILLQHLLLGFPLLIHCIQVGCTATVASLLRALRSVLPCFLHSLVSVTTKKSLNSDLLKDINHSDQAKKTTDSLNKTSSEDEKKSYSKLSQSSKVIESKSSTLIPTSANYFRLPSSPSIEAYEALEIDTLVLVVRAPPVLNPTHFNESNLGFCRNVSFVSRPKDSPDIQNSNFQSSGSKMFGQFDSSSTDRKVYDASTDHENHAWKPRQFIKRCKFQLEDVSGRPYFGSSAVAFASEALHRDWCTLVRSIISACTNTALRDDTLHLTVHHALLSWCSKAKLWDSLLTEQRPSAANSGTTKSNLISTSADRPVSPKPKNSFGFSLAPPQWPKFLSSSRPKKQTESTPQKRDKRCDRYEVVGLYPSLYESSALGDYYTSVETSKVGEMQSQNSNVPVAISSIGASSKPSVSSNANAMVGSQQSLRNRITETSNSSNYYESTTERSRKSSNLPSSPAHLIGRPSISSSLKPEVMNTKLDSGRKRVNKLYPSISEEDVSMPSGYNAEFHNQSLDPELFIRPVSSQSSLASGTLKTNMFTPETLDPASLTSLTSLSSAVGLPESHLQKILLAVGASEVDVPLLQCWAFYLRATSSSTGSR